MTTTNLKNDAQDACASALRQHGFVSKRRGLLLQPGASKTVTGWLGLNLATWSLPMKLQVNPVVGVRHIPLEGALVELAGWKAPVACVSSPLGHLMPENMFRQWDFLADEGLAPVAEDLAREVAEYGQPFIDKWSDWEVFSADVAESGLLLDNERFIQLPLIAALNGDRQLADELVQRELQRVGDSEDAYSRGYRDFASRFAAKVFG